MEPDQSSPTTCPKCQKPYDFALIPLEFPCGHSFCEECLTKSLSADNRFLCSFDDKTYNLKIKDLPIPNFYRLIMHKFRQTQNNPNKLFMCSKHKDEPMKFICEEHNEFLCCLCLRDHAKHADSTKIYVEEDLLLDIKRVEERFNQMKGVLDDLKQKLQNIRMMKIFNTAELKSFFSEAEKLLVYPFCKSISDEKKGFPLCSVIVPQKSFWTESILVKESPNKEYLETMFDGNEITQTKLLFTLEPAGMDFEVQIFIDCVITKTLLWF